MHKTLEQINAFKRLVKRSLTARTGIEFGIFIDEKPDGTLFVKRAFNYELDIDIHKNGLSLGISDLAR